MSGKATAVKKTKKVVKKKAVKSSKSTKQSKKSLKLKEEQIESLILDHRENGRKLARSMLTKWRVRMPAEEIDSIVDLTLCDAARRFSFSRGASFMTFLFYHLRGNLIKAVTDASNATNVFVAFAEKTGINVKESSRATEQAVINYFPDHVTLKGIDEKSPENILLEKEQSQICSSSCSRLDELEQEVIVRSFKNEQALVDIAKSLGYSRCHISRVKKRALERLKTIIGEVSGQETKGKSSTAEKSRRSRRKRLPTTRMTAKNLTKRSIRAA